MRFGLSAKSVADVNDVKTSLIKTRRIVFTPSTDLKDELRNTSVIITCYDRNGQEVKRVTSADDGTVEEPENTDSTVDEGENGTSQSGGGSSQSGSGTGTVTPSNGGGSDSGSQTSGGTSGDGGSGGGDDGFSFG